MCRQYSPSEYGKAMPLLLNILVVLFGASAIALSLWVYRRQQHLSERQDGLLHEIENLASDHRRLLEQVHGLSHKQRVMTDRIRDAGNIEATPEPEDPARGGKQNLRQDVLFLDSQGLSAEIIARDLDVAIGEVELILGMNRYKAKH